MGTFAAWWSSWPRSSRHFHKCSRFCAPSSGSSNCSRLFRFSPSIRQRRKASCGQRSASSPSWQPRPSPPSHPQGQEPRNPLCEGGWGPSRLSPLSTKYFTKTWWPEASRPGCCILLFNNYNSESQQIIYPIIINFHKKNYSNTDLIDHFVWHNNEIKLYSLMLMVWLCAKFLQTWLSICDQFWHIEHIRFY